jgi:hypothetical protein
MRAQCQGAYALKEFSEQTLSSRIGKKTKFEVLQLEGEITEKYLSESPKIRPLTSCILKTRPHKVGVRQIRSRKFCYFCKILCV